MFPLVATVDELKAALALLDRAGPRPEGLEVGVMVEVPSAALSAGALAPLVDFFSMGTNDLAQYTLAADRGNEHVGNLADPLHPAVLRLIAAAAGAARANGRWIGVCGELASEPLAAAALIGLGVTELSVSPPRVAEVKQAVRAVDAGRAETLSRTLLEAESAADVRARLAEAA
jgi:phosphoenolpyruvate-protein kinase (PTS system EI component)